MPFDLSTAKPVSTPSRFDLSTARPVSTQAPDATALERGSALAAGVNRAVAGAPGIPVDTAANVLDLAKALVGAIYGQAAEKKGQPLKQPKSVRMFDVDENGQLVPSRSFDSANIPSALQVDELPFQRHNLPLSGQYFADKLDDATEAVSGERVTTPLRPDDAASRYLYAAGQGAGAALITPGRPLITAAPARVAPQLTAAGAGVTGGTAGQFAAEHGADPAVQAAASFAGSMAPSAARVGVAESARQLARGGEAGRRRVEENIRAFEDAGTKPSIGQATESRVARSTESLLTRTPGAAGRMAQKGEAQSAEMGGRIEGLADELAPR